MKHGRTLVFAAVLAGTVLADGAAHAAACAVPGQWVDPLSGLAARHDALIAETAKHPVVLLGERHDSAEHHRWQLHTLAALHAREPNMVIGFEMFPRRVQPALDRWVRGELTVKEFLAESSWAEVWGFEPGLYLPLFHFARQHRLPMVALNVDRSVVSRIGRDGWAAVPSDERAGLSDPAAPPEAYRDSLARVFAVKKRVGTRNVDMAAPMPEIADDEIAAAKEDSAFGRFVEAQLTWDRAMAEAIAEARRRPEAPLVVGIVGAGHAEHGWGIGTQLADLGIKGTSVLLPVTPEACAELPTDAADAVFVVERRAEPTAPRPRLGVFIETADGGARVMQVVEGSVAEAAKIEAGDVIIEAAGQPVTSSADLIAIVRRQAPGTWLPLTVKRDRLQTEIVARFPTRFDGHP